MRRRRITRYSELTSLLDVLFILLFASLIQAAGLVDAAEGREKEAQADEPEPVAEETADALARRVEPSVLKDRAVEQLAQSIRDRSAVYVRVGADGRLTSIEIEGAGDRAPLQIEAPLLEPVDDPDVRVEYSARLRPELRLCTRVRITLGLPDLSQQLVVIAPDSPISALPIALVEGLRADQSHCFTDERGIATVVPPDSEP